MSSPVTCIIPTRNRADFMRRCLLFLRLQGYNHQIIIADSSNDQSKGAISDLSAKAGLPNVRLVQFPYETGFYRKMAAAIRLVTTPYVYFLADDDFIFGEGVERCIKILERNPKLAAAAGTIYVYNQTKKAPAASLLPYPLTIYPQKNELSHDIVARISNHIANYSATFYSVYRTDPVRSAFNEVARRTESLRAGEIFSSTYVLALGRRAIIAESLGLRVSHEEATHKLIPSLGEEQGLEGLLWQCLTGLWILSGLNDSETAAWERWVAAVRKYLLRVSIPDERANHIADSLAFRGPNNSAPESDQPIDGVDVKLGPGDNSAVPEYFMRFGKRPILLSVALSSIAPLGISHDRAIPEFLDELSQNIHTMPYADIV